METIVIDSRKPISFVQLRILLEKHWNVEEDHTGSLVIHGTVSRIYLHLQNNESIKADRLLVDYSDLEFVKKVLEIIADDDDVMIDNDFGLMLPGNEFVSRIKGESNWDWRK